MASTCLPWLYVWPWYVWPWYVGSIWLWLVGGLNIVDIRVTGYSLWRCALLSCVSPIMDVIPVNGYNIHAPRICPFLFSYFVPDLVSLLCCGIYFLSPWICLSYFSLYLLPFLFYSTDLVSPLLKLLVISPLSSSILPLFVFCWWWRFRFTF